MSGVRHDPQIALSELRTVRDWLRWTVSEMNRHDVQLGQGCFSVWDDAVFLVLRSLKLPVDQLEPFLDASVLPHERELLSQRVGQRCLDRIPTSYLVGEAWLQGYRFLVTPEVLIPRSPISELVCAGLEPWITAGEQMNRIADICTGSGCLAILAALQFPNARVDATDISEAALQVAEANVRDYGLSTTVHLHRGNLLEPLPANVRYDLIISNPPYVNSASMSCLPAEFEHEPSLALAGGTDGMDLVRQILEQARTRLTAQGHLLLEIGHEADHFEAAFPEIEPLWLDTQATSRQIMLLSAEQLGQ